MSEERVWQSGILSVHASRVLLMRLTPGPLGPPLPVNLPTWVWNSHNGFSQHSPGWGLKDDGDEKEYE